jgi:hypothetical protein
MNARRRFLCALGLVAVLGACSEPKPKPPPEEVPIPKLGVVGHISEIKERAMTRDNWKDLVGGLFSRETEGNVAYVRYEVTVFYDDNSTGVVKVDEKPAFAPGQRVRVTGNKIDPVRR